jgi:hypothetical protein
MLTADLFFVLCYAFAEALSDKTQIERELPIDHTKGGIERAAALVGFAFLVHWHLFNTGHIAQGFLLVVATVVCNFMFFWLNFDALLNILRKKNILYVGQDKRTAWLDKMAAKFLPMQKDTENSFVFVCVKSIALCLSVTAYTLLV